MSKESLWLEVIGIDNLKKRTISIKRLNIFYV